MRILDLQDWCGFCGFCRLTGFWGGGHTPGAEASFFGEPRDPKLKPCVSLKMRWIEEEKS
jgi:hypothetical protein